VTFPRRQQLRRAARAGRAGTCALILAGAAMASAPHAIAVLFGLLALVCAARAARWARLARRSGVGAGSERRVRGALCQLERDGWRIRHSLPAPGGGDIDHLAMAPGGLTVLVETKTRTYTHQHVERTRALANWLVGRRRTWATRVVPVICLAAAHGVERFEGGVLVVSLERLVPLLRELAREARYPLVDEEQPPLGRRAHRQGAL
jgi:hypothetical protein